MTFTVGGVDFHGSFADPLLLENQPGIFLLIASYDSSNEVIDFGYVDDVRHELTDEQTNLFKVQLEFGNVQAGALYTGDAQQARVYVDKVEDWYDRATEPIVNI